MTLRTLFLLTFALCAGWLPAAETDYQLKVVEGLPKELGKDVADVLNEKGHQIAGPDGVLVELWLAKGVEVKPTFKPTFTVKYPFKTGQLIGAIRVAKDSPFSDFRGQDIKPGVYTLRYGQQPMDGNHLGTAETADFLMALPAESDTSPALIRFAKQLNEKSSEAAGSDHPAIFWLAPPTEDAAADALVRDEDRSFWILNLSADTDAGDAKVPVRLVVIGKSDV